jgi:hypothetical protein
MGNMRDGRYKTERVNLAVAFIVNISGGSRVQASELYKLLGDALNEKGVETLSVETEIGRRIVSYNIDLIKGEGKGNPKRLKGGALLSRRLLATQLALAPSPGGTPAANDPFSGKISKILRIRRHLFGAGAKAKRKLVTLGVPFKFPVTSKRGKVLARRLAQDYAIRSFRRSETASHNFNDRNTPGNYGSHGIQPRRIYRIPLAEQWIEFYKSPEYKAYKDAGHKGLITERMYRRTTCPDVTNPKIKPCVKSIVASQIIRSC